MDYNTVLQMVSTIGFPIAMCIYLLFYIKSFDEKYCQQLNNMAKAIENNTLAITKLMGMIDDLEDRLSRSESR